MKTIHTKDFGGFNKAHQDHLGEGDRDVTGEANSSALLLWIFQKIPYIPCWQILLKMPYALWDSWQF